MSGRSHATWTMLALVVGTLFGPGPRAVAGPPSPTGPEAVEAQRAANLKAYEAAKEGLRRDKAGKWVVIADGKVVTWGAKPEEIVGAAPKALHRFFFQVGEEGDASAFITAWYGPRFAGLGLGGAVGADVSFGESVLFEKGGKTAAFTGGPFPRARVRISTAGGKPEVLDVFAGSVGPDLLVTPEDAERMSLARAEVPGTLTIGRELACRRVLLHVGIEGLAADGWLVGAVPKVSRARLAELARARDAGFLGEWSSTWEPVRNAQDGKWVLFGVDRVLGAGDTPAAALAAGEGVAPEAQHRLLVKLPLGEPVSYDRASFTTEATLTLGGETVKVRTSVKDPDVVLADADTAARLRLELAEEGREVALLDGTEKKAARAGAAWRGTARLGAAPAPGLGPKDLVWVVYPVP